MRVRFPPAALRMQLETKKPKIIVIVGQTGSGKTACSIELAQKYNGEIVNADSRQVYAGLNIGTEKITEDQMKGIPHHLLSIVPPQEVYTAQQFVQDAQNAIADIHSRGKLPIIVGGTFFYIDMLLGKISHSPVPPNPELRRQLEAHDESELFAMLQERDPIRAANIDKQNKRRLLRALEILHVLPRVPEPRQEDCTYTVLQIGLRVDKQILRSRLRERAQRALERGLVEETQNLLAEGVSRERLSEIGLEYRLVLDFIDQKLSHDELLQKLEEKNWQYAKRQMVWLKRDQSIAWFDPADVHAITEEAQSFIAV